MSKLFPVLTAIGTVGALALGLYLYFQVRKLWGLIEKRREDRDAYGGR